nr:hypothetical protein [uncultured Methanolobus sp.]
MDFNELLLFLGIIVLILVVSRFTSSSTSSPTYHTKPQSTKVKISSNHIIGVSNIDTDIKNIIDFLENEVKLRYGKNKKEKDYQDDLFQAFGVLRERYGYDIKYEDTNGKHRVDLSINDAIGIELKVHRGGSQVKKELFNQITDYAPYYHKIMGVVVNISEKDKESEIKDDICNKLKQQNVISENDYYIVILNI